MALRNAFGSLALDATLIQARDYLSAIATSVAANATAAGQASLITLNTAARDYLAQLAGRTNQKGDAYLVSGSRWKYRRDFPVAATALADFDTAIISGTPTVTANAGSVTLVSGTATGNEASITTKQSFSVPMRVLVGLQVSAKNANHEVYIELVSEDPTTGLVDDTVMAGWATIGSMTNVQGRTEVRNGGAARSLSATVATTNHVGSPITWQIVVESDEVWFSNFATDSAISRSAASVRNSIAPDPTRNYRIRVRTKNNGAVGSSVTTTVTFVTAIDYTEQKVEVTGGTGDTSAGNSVPVAVTSISTANNAVSLAANSAVVVAASATTGGSSAAKVLSAASTNATLVKATAGRVYGYHLTNTTATVKYFRFFNKATAPTVGTDSPPMVIAIPPNDSVDIAHTIPLAFTLGIGYAITGANPDLDATAVAAGDVVGAIIYI